MALSWFQNEIGASIYKTFVEAKEDGGTTILCIFTDEPICKVSSPFIVFSSFQNYSDVAEYKKMVFYNGKKELNNFCSAAFINRFKHPNSFNYHCKTYENFRIFFFGIVKDDFYVVTLFWVIKHRHPDQYIGIKGYEHEFFEKALSLYLLFIAAFMSSTLTGLESLLFLRHPQNGRLKGWEGLSKRPWPVILISNSSPILRPACSRIFLGIVTLPCEPNLQIPITISFALIAILNLNHNREKNQ